MLVRSDDPRPPYVQLAAELREAIENGQYRPGDRLPPARELARANGIAVMTVRHAYDVLRDEGLIVGHQGRGTFVQDRGRAAPDAEGSGRHAGRTPTDEEPELESDIGAVLEDLDAIRRHLGDEAEPAPDDLDEAIKILEQVRARLDAQAAQRRAVAHDPVHDPGQDLGPDVGL